MLIVAHATSFITSLVEAVAAGFIAIAQPLISTLLQPIFAFVYLLTFWAPLQFIDAISTMFKFFATGFMAKIFGATYNPDGSIAYSFD
jgi:hypothetical protein